MKGHTERSYKGGCETEVGKLPAKRICHRQVAKKEAEGRKSRPGLPDRPGEMESDLFYKLLLI